MNKEEELKQLIIDNYLRAGNCSVGKVGLAKFGKLEQESIKAIKEYASKERKEAAVEFVVEHYMPRTPIIVDGYKQTVKKIGERYDNWIKQKEGE